MAKRLYTIDLASRRVVVIPLGSVFPFWCPALFPALFLRHPARSLAAVPLVFSLADGGRWEGFGC
jgi:hypothetical protein